MAEEVANPETAPPSQERGLFTLYGLFDKKKEEVEPEESLHEQPSVTQASEHRPANPPHADQPATPEIKVEEEERPQDEYKSMPHTDSETKPAHFDPEAAAAANEEDKEGWHPTHIHDDNDDDASPAVEKEERQDDQIIPPATTHADSQSTQPADIYSTPTGRPNVAAPVENSQGHAYSDEGQHFTREDEKQHTKGSSSSSEYASDDDDEEDDEKSEEEKDEKKKEFEKKSTQEKIAEKYPHAESVHEEKKEEKKVDNMYENLPNKTEEKKNGGRKKRSMKDKIKGKLAGGGHPTTDQESGTGEEEKKAGLLDRIKDKIPGHHAKE